MQYCANEKKNKKKVKEKVKAHLGYFYKKLE